MINPSDFAWRHGRAITEDLAGSLFGWLKNPMVLFESDTLITRTFGFGRSGMN
jgi:hypothetical protein